VRCLVQLSMMRERWGLPGRFGAPGIRRVLVCPAWPEGTDGGGGNSRYRGGNELGQGNRGARGVEGMGRLPLRPVAEAWSPRMKCRGRRRSMQT
jgi:hypothetical protein